MKHVLTENLEVKRLDDGQIRARRSDRGPLTEEDKKLALALVDDDALEALKIFGGFIEEVK